MDNFILEAVALDDRMDILQMLREIGPGENGFQNAAYSLSEQEFPNWLQSCVDMSQGINLDPKYVPMTTFWLRRNGYPIGMSKLRIRLNEALLRRGGHIGFCIRPTERGKGYALIVLKKTLEYANQMGLKKVLLTCNFNNYLSWKTIEKCEGKLEKIEDGERYYWIEVPGELKQEIDGEKNEAQKVNQNNI